MAAIFFGGEAFSYMSYSWIAILVNVPATLFATGYYEFLMRDSLSKIGKGHAVHEDGEEGLQRHITRTVSRCSSNHWTGERGKIANDACVLQGVIETGAANMLRDRQGNGIADDYELGKQE